MSNQILHKRTSAPSAAPTAAQLALGELALNTADGTWFLKKTDDSVIDIRKPAVADGDNVFLTATIASAAHHYDATQASSLTLVDDKVSQWDDLSGNNLHLTQTTADRRPGLTTVNDRTALDFDGVDDCLRVVRASTRPATYIAVVVPKTATNGCIFSDTSGTASPRLIVTNSSTTLALRETSVSDLSLGGIAVEEPSIVAARGSLNSADVLLRRIGNPSTATSGAQITSNFGGLLIGARDVGGTLSLPMAMRFGELLIYNRVLSLAEIEVLEGYLAWKWGLQARLPYTHPYAGSFFGFGSQALPSDPDALTYLAAVSFADGATLETGVANAVDAFVRGCKADNSWSAFRATCILAGARTLAGAIVPLRGAAPTNFNFVEADYNRRTGLVGNGSNKRLGSNYINEVAAWTNRHDAVYVHTASTANSSRYFNSTLANPANFAAVATAANTLLLRSFMGGQITAPAGSGSDTGLIGMARTADTMWTYRRAGVTARSNTTVTATQGSGAPLATELGWFAAANNSLYINGRMQFASAGYALDLQRLDARVTRLIAETAFFLNTGLSGQNYDTATLQYINAGYAAGGSLA